VDTDDLKVSALKTAVRAAQNEFDMAITFHEIWKPAAYDKELHARMGNSFATNAFHVVRAALRREMLLALMRMWDTNPKSVRMERHIGPLLRNQQIIDALAEERADRWDWPGVKEQMRLDIAKYANEALAIIDIYSKGGSDNAILQKIRTLRHEHLAHHQVRSTTEKGPDTTDAELESCFQCNLKLIPILLHVIGAGYSTEESAEIHRRYAKLFWASMKGERTRGHPDYREPPSIAPQIT
jgi:hypothetical protein